MKKKILLIVIVLVSVVAIVYAYFHAPVGASDTLLCDLENTDITKWYVLCILIIFPISVVGWAVYELIVRPMK